MGMAMSALLPTIGHAQWSHEYSIETRATGTSNAALAPNDQARADLALELRPRVRVTRRSANLNLVAEGALDLVDYTRKSQPSRALPSGTATAQASLVERLLFLDASLDVRQVEVNPFGIRAGALATSNERTQTSRRLSPYFKSDLSSSTTLLGRLDDSVTKYGGDTAEDHHAQSALLRIERQPRPLGLTGELSTQTIRYGTGANSELMIDGARGSLDRSLGGDGVASLVAGTERTRMLFATHTDAVYGARLNWSPTPRTQVAADVEHRFFGVGGEISLQHRMPFMSFTLHAQRQPLETPSSLGVAPAGSTYRSYIDAALAGSNPDPTLRAIQVDHLLNTLGLQGSLPVASAVLADYAQLQTGLDASVVFLGSRNMLTLSAFTQTLRWLVRADDPLGASPSAAGDNRQISGLIGWNHRLTPQSSFDLSLRRSSVVGLAVREGERTTETGLRLSWVYNLSPRSVLTVGGQRLAVRTTVPASWPYDNDSGFVGLRHLF